jgi:anti-sigma B factor antagonist
MELTTQELDHVDLITIKGRVDSVQAARLAEALESANQRGRYKLVIDMSQLEYMSSAGFRALAAAQRNSKHNNRGEVVLVQVPSQVYEGLEVVGFTEYFRIVDDMTSALELATNLPAGDSAAGTPASPS